MILEYIELDIKQTLYFLSNTVKYLKFNAEVNRGIYYISIFTCFYVKLVDCLEKCLIYGHIRRFAD